MKSNVLQAYRNYRRSNAYDIYDVYKSPSYAKVRAWRYCVNVCEELGGHGLKIVSHTSQHFSVGFEYTDPKTGVASFVWHTAYNTYTAEIPAEEIA